jgi:hypothetical protein
MNDKIEKSHNINNYLVDIRIAFEEEMNAITNDIGNESEMNYQMAFTYAIYRVLLEMGANDPQWCQFLTECLSEVMYHDKS